MGADSFIIEQMLTIGVLEIIFRLVTADKTRYELYSIDRIFPSTYKKQTKLYEGRFSSRAFTLPIKWCHKIIGSEHCKKLLRKKTEHPVLKYMPQFIRRRLVYEEPLPLLYINDGSRFSIVIKRISYSIKRKDIRNEYHAAAVNEILAGSLRHPAIVPLLGMAHDKFNNCYYLVFPYMKHLDVRRCLNDENSVIDKDVWKKILYQISCALVFLHTEVKDFRGKIVHGDVTSSNILLDQDYNARLADFGQSRELPKGKDGVKNYNVTVTGTPGYYDENRTDYLNTETDIRYFGIVVLEVLTLCKPAIYRDYDIETPLLTKSENELIQEYAGRKQFWGNSTFEDLLLFAIQCREGQLKAKDVCNSLKNFLVDVQKPYIVTSDEICQSCLVTKKVKDVSLHFIKCQLKICVNCLRNTCINPITCLTCLKDVPCPIGNNTGAIFLKGYSEDEHQNRQFVNDVLAVRSAMVTRHPLSIGIREENTYIVSSMDEINEIKTGLQEKNIKVLIIFYSGDAEEDSNKLKLRENDVDATELSQNLAESGITCVLCIFDCCYGPDIGDIDNVLVIQLKSSGRLEMTEGRYDNSKNSVFTTGLLRALQGSNSDEIGSPFIYVEDLRTMIDNGNVEVKTHIYGINSPKTARFAFHNKHKLKISIMFVSKRDGTKYLMEISELPYYMSVLKERLLRRLYKKRKKTTIPIGYSDVFELTTYCSGELNTILQVENAHGRGMVIEIRERQLENIRNGRVPVFSGFSPLKVYRYCVACPDLWSSPMEDHCMLSARIEIRNWRHMLHHNSVRSLNRQVHDHLLHIRNGIDASRLQDQGYRYISMVFPVDKEFTQEGDFVVFTKEFYILEIE